MKQLKHIYCVVFCCRPGPGCLHVIASTRLVIIYNGDGLERKQSYRQTIEIVHMRTYYRLNTVIKTYCERTNRRRQDSALLS